MQYFYCLIFNILDIFSKWLLTFISACSSDVIDSISMNFYVVKPDIRLSMFNF